MPNTPFRDPTPEARGGKTERKTERKTKRQKETKKVRKKESKAERKDKTRKAKKRKAEQREDKKRKERRKQTNKPRRKDEEGKEKARGCQPNGSTPPRCADGFVGRRSAYVALSAHLMGRWAGSAPHNVSF